MILVQNYYQSTAFIGLLRGARYIEATLSIECFFTMGYCLETMFDIHFKLGGLRESCL